MSMYSAASTHALSLSNRRLLTWIAGGLYLTLVTGAIYVLFPLWLYDDPFIIYRYAANLAQGNGFVYNLGEHTLSSTSILLVLLLAGLYHLSANLPRWAVLISSLCLALGGLALWDLARSWHTPLVGWAALLLYPTFPLLLITISSEMSLVLALSLAAWAAYARRRYTIAAALAALAVLARPDAFLVAAILATCYVWKHRRRLGYNFPWRALLLFCGILLAWALFAWLYFGSPLPRTLGVKHYQGLMAQASLFLPGLFRQAAKFLHYPFWWLEMLLVAAGVQVALVRYRKWLPFLSWALVYSLAYTLLGVTNAAWYYAPLAPSFVAATGLGLLAAQQRWGPRLSAWLERRRAAHPGGLGRLSPARPWLLILLAALLFAGQARLMWGLHTAPDPRFPVYRSIGKWLANQTPPEARVGVLEIGIIGYFSGRTMIDFAGLLQPGTVAYLEDSSYDAVALRVVEQYRPEYIVLQDSLLPQLEAGPIARFCQVGKRLPAGFYGYDWQTTVYVCHYNP